jgi:hypothetical protein
MMTASSLFGGVEPSSSGSCVADSDSITASSVRSGGVDAVTADDASLISVSEDGFATVSEASAVDSGVSVGSVSAG